MLFCTIHLKDSESEATDRSRFRNTWDRCWASPGRIDNGRRLACLPAVPGSMSMVPT
jgi:hypothetical protein